jgi:hypothetical protein
MIYSYHLFCDAELRTLPIILPELRIMAPETPSEADFRTLGLKPGSKHSEVRRAYLALVKKWHPDRHHSQSYETKALAEKKFREIDEAYRRIFRNFQKTPRTPRSHAKPAGPWPGPAAARKLKTKPHPTAAQDRSTIAIRPFSGAKIILPILLFATVVFILTQLPSFFPDTGVDTGTSRVAENPTGGKAADSRQPSQPPGAQSSDDLFDSAVPDSLPPPPALLQSAPSDRFFTLGSTTSEVLHVQGPPTRVQGQIWAYGLSEIQFKNGRVWKFNNFDGSLRVRMLPEAPQDLALGGHVTIGSTEDEVLLVQGTPTRVEGDRWFYGFSELVFKNRRVAEYDNYFGNLKILLIPSPPSGPENPANFFTIGSTPDQVLAVQGTPTSVHGNRWSFNFAAVSFREGKVYNVTDTEGTLRFTAPEQTSGDGGR